MILTPNFRRATLVLASWWNTTKRKKYKSLLGLASQRTECSRIQMRMMSLMAMRTMGIKNKRRIKAATNPACMNEHDIGRIG